FQICLLPISIDDREQAYLKALCDEVFGEENFVCGFPRVTKKGGKSSKAFAKNHDFIMGYCKNKDNNDIFNSVAHNDAGFCNSDEYFDDRGFYKLAQTLDYSSLQYSKTMDYELNIKGELFIPGGNKEQQKLRHLGKRNAHDWVWRWSKDLVKFGLENGFIEIKNSGDRPRIYTKTYQNAAIAKINNCYKVVLKRRTKALSTLEFSENIYSNDNAKKEIDNILWEGCFEYVKPSVLIKKIAEIATSKDSIILDFFAGSGTTGQAVMELNEEDGGNRKCILVTNNENNIALNITRERLYRVINGKGSKGEEIKWGYSKNKKSLINNQARVFEIKNYPLTLQDLDKAEKLTDKALIEFKKLNPAYKQVGEFDIYNELSALNPYKKEEVK
ncbi:MAG: site-specific DNA-methyltransferase, partial [Endomicrobium sp.]|nr:site-specific DNA-methyltransferase [Endomicrobium sp.]